MAPLAKPAIDAVRDGRIWIIPEHFAKVYFNWMEKIEDWCISRQLWWGHRMPVCIATSATVSPSRSRTRPNAASAARPSSSGTPTLLDTWFSSALWPHSTLGWPEQTEDLGYFHPTSVLETGHDILFFWVARMIMMGLQNTSEIPFDTVYLHGLIRDPEGSR